MKKLRWDLTKFFYIYGSIIVNYLMNGLIGHERSPFKKKWAARFFYWPSVIEWFSYKKSSPIRYIYENIYRYIILYFQIVLNGKQVTKGTSVANIFFGGKMLASIVLSLCKIQQQISINKKKKTFAH